MFLFCFSFLFLLIRTFVKNLSCSEAGFKLWPNEDSSQRKFGNANLHRETDLARRTGKPGQASRR